MIINSNSHRFGEYSKICNNVLDTNSFSYQSSRRQSFIQRLYFEYLYTQQVQGQCFFYTLTYNDRSIPRYKTTDGQFDYPCFSYADIRYVTNGILSKELLRKYGSRLKYFIACESGEGQGKRGKGYNPHYHCLFFVQPVHDKDNKPVYVHYKKISPFEFRALLRRVWQGSSGYIDYQFAKYGICKEGDNCGLVKGVAPFRYCSKYVLKDSDESDFENKIYDYAFEYAKHKGFTLDVLWMFYKFNRDVLNDEQPHFIFEYLSLSAYNKWRHMTSDPDKSYLRYITRYGSIGEKVMITELNQWFTNTYLYLYANNKVNEYRRLYSAKPRFSKGLGEYGLHFINDIDFNPTFNIPDSKDFECQTPCQYYYRKLYYNKIKCDVTGNTLYRLNDLGITMKLNRFPVAVEHKLKILRESIDIIYNNHFDISVYNSFELFRTSKILNKLIDSPIRNDIFNKYAIYDIVYRNRFYSDDDFIALSPTFELDSVRCDYIKFLESDSYFFDYDFFTCYRKHYLNRSRHLKSFDYHPSIYPFIDTFKFLDNLIDVVSDFRSEYSKRLWQENKERCKKIKHFLHNSNT